jgi:hypothetical protein
LTLRAGAAMNNLAVTYSALGRHADALAMEERVLEFRRQCCLRIILTSVRAARGGMGCMRCCNCDALFFRHGILQHQLQLRDKRFPASRAGVRA